MNKEFFKVEKNQLNSMYAVFPVNSLFDSTNYYFFNSKKEAVKCSNKLNNDLINFDFYSSPLIDNIKLLFRLSYINENKELYSVVFYQLFNENIDKLIAIKNELTELNSEINNNSLNDIINVIPVIIEGTIFLNSSTFKITKNVKNLNKFGVIKNNILYL